MAKFLATRILETEIEAENWDDAEEEARGYSNEEFVNVAQVVEVLSID